MRVDMNESIAALAEDIQARVRAHGGYLTGVALQLPPGLDAATWESALEARLADFGFEAIDVRSAPGSAVAIAELYFDAGWAE